MSDHVHLDLIADFSALPPDAARDLLRQWRAADPAGEAFTRATCAVPAGLDLDPGRDAPRGWRLLNRQAPGAWDEVLALSGREGAHGLVITAGVAPCLDAAGVLVEALASDPMVGAAVTRLRCDCGCSIAALGGPDSRPEWLPQPVLADLAPVVLAGDVTGPCVLCTPVVLADFSEDDAPSGSLHAALQRRLVAARRCGFRSVLANRAVARVPGVSCGEPPPEAAAPGVRAAGAGPACRTWEEFRGRATAKYERMAGRRIEVAGGRRSPSLLLDLRNLRAAYNGTAFAALGAASGLACCGTDWRVTILAHPDGAGFHAFDRTFPQWTVRTEPSDEIYDAALRLSQPWHVEEIADLHAAARVNAYLVLDTIAWDVVYAAPPRLDGAWRLLASAADGLLFISEFSRQRFQTRFGAAAASDVCHLSFDPADYIRPQLANAPAGESMVVVGNALDHKDVGPTVALLASAFPSLPIEVLGPSPFRSRRIRSHASGQLDDEDVHRLYATARLVVFPSFYEGFGFPIVQALAYGRTLLARRSPLLEEIAAGCPPGGRLIGYERRDQLVDRIGALLHGEPVPDLPVGAGLHGPPRGWPDVGRQIDRFLRQLLHERPMAAWAARDTLVSELRAAQAGG